MEQSARLRTVKDFRAYKRNLPHFEQPGSIYFVTFNAAEGLSLLDAAKDIVFSSIKFHTGKMYNLHACAVMETHIYIILQPLVAQPSSPVDVSKPVAQSSSPVRHTSAESQDAFYSLSRIMHSIKSYSSHQIKQLADIERSIWLDENYDRIIRDDKEYLEKVNYIINNPLKVGLVDKPEDYRWLYVEGSD